MTYDLADRLKTFDATGTANDATSASTPWGRFRTRTVNAVTDTHSDALGETIGTGSAGARTPGASLGTSPPP